MLLIIDNHKFHYELESLCRVFYPDEKIRKIYETTYEKHEKIVFTSMKETGETSELFVSVNIAEKQTERKKDCTSDDDAELLMATMLYECLSECTAYTPKWGLQTGVRPSKLMLSLIEHYGDEGAKRYFRDKLLVSEKKTLLAYDVAKREEKIIKKSKKNSFSLYISIPFCPTRCNYCSFVSHSIEKTQKLIKPYVDKLCQEIKLTGGIAKNIGVTLETVYFGGGTPTTLSAEDLARLFKTIESSFDLSSVFEYTVEAGRPDTISKEKLIILKSHNVGRISINPQTFNNEILKTIGRNHTVEDFYSAFNLARQCSFDTINIDLIAGLTNDTQESFKNSLESAKSIKPENITVHTLSLKRSSDIVEKDETSLQLKGNIVEEMVKTSHEMLTNSGYLPYYMYRQSKSLGNLENVGFCIEGMECAYNIFMMEESQTILSCGAGAVTKLKSPDGKSLERIFNYKYPYEYIDRFEELIKRKNKILQVFK